MLISKISRGRPPYPPSGKGLRPLPHLPPHWPLASVPAPCGGWIELQPLKFHLHLLVQNLLKALTTLTTFRVQFAFVLVYKTAIETATLLLRIDDIVQGTKRAEGTEGIGAVAQA